MNFEKFLRENGFLKMGETMQMEFPINATIKLYDNFQKQVKNNLVQPDVSSAKQNDIKDMILAESQKGNIVVSTFEGFQVAPLKEIIKQPIDGLLYDLNRNEAVVLTFINDPKWINDYAMMQVVRELKQQLEDKTK